MSMPLMEEIRLTGWNMKHDCKYQLARWISSINSRTSRQKKSRNFNLQKYPHCKGMLHCGEWHGCFQCFISIMSHVRLRLPSSRAPCARTAASSILLFFLFFSFGAVSKTKPLRPRGWWINQWNTLDGCIKYIYILCIYLCIEIITYKPPKVEHKTQN